MSISRPSILMKMNCCQLRCRGSILTTLLVGTLCLSASCKSNPSESSSGGASASDAALGDAGSDGQTGQAVEHPLPPEVVEGFVNPQHLPAYHGPTGSIEGTVTLKGDPSPDTKNRDYTKCPEGELAYKKLFREGPARDDGSRPIADALVAVTGYSGAYIPESKAARKVTIEDCALTERTIDVTIGQRIEIQNITKSKIFAPALLQQPSPLALVAAAMGDPVNLYPRAPHIFTLYDKFGAGSSYLTGDVYVLVQPLHSVTDLTGHYRIDGVPVGDVKVNALLGVIQKEATKSVNVQANVVATVNLELEYTTPPPAPVLAPSTPPPHPPRGDAGRPHILK
jgi:hypothetical protein